MFAFSLFTALLQNGADPSIRNSEGKTPYDLADPGSTQAVFTGEHMKHQVLEAARSGNEERCVGLPNDMLLPHFALNSTNDY